MIPILSNFNVNSELLVGLAVLVFSYIFLLWWRRQRNLPPGPWGLPFIGAAFRLTANLHEDFVKFGKQYGDVFSLNLGNKLYVVLNNAESIHDGFGKIEDFSDRPHDNILSTITQMKDQIFTYPYGEQWKENKKFALKALRSFGFGTVSIESKVSVETQALQEYLLSKKNDPIELRTILSKVSLNVILSILMNVRYDWDDPWSDKLIQIVRNVFGAFGYGHVAMMFEFLPTLSKIIYRRQVNNLIREVVEFRKFVKKHIDYHRASFDPAHNRDVIDVYLKEGKLAEIGEEAITDTILMLILDALETNGIILSWIMLYVTAHPEVQTRIHRELDDVVGQGRSPVFTDRATLPYTEAAMIEAIRVCNSVTLSASHKPLRDTTFKGFFIPENATIVGNIFNVHSNPEAYPDVHVYKPERFLGENGRQLLREHYMPFGVGRRMCMGESLVQIENFLIFTSLMHRFSFSFPSDQPAPSLKPATTGLIQTPHEYKITATPR